MTTSNVENEVLQCPRRLVTFILWADCACQMPSRTVWIVKLFLKFYMSEVSYKNP